MYKHLLVPTDGSPLSDTAVDQALALARALDAKVTLFTAVEPFQVFAYLPEQVAETRDAYERHARAAAARRLEQAAQKAAAAGVAHASAVADSADPHESIIATAKEKGCDLIAMASHGRRGVKALVLGSVTAKVLTYSNIPVLVYRDAG
ncbi:universal stress protein [Pseudoxanthomonas broegbernensis]|uniref:Universal stress protein n=1 Tax=Pseudoxanthomonas broegbernensis TaxID=83619 RepID=A0A7V8K664_9GAMM|nr:universal stress protein [Pseudoxanthomonas broegbernensis]KAF1684645.1 universal stress protein [Pseudoxanthomonas broegbernensis]MBB6063483.1 nucleotide-binding universal stress UspA family protein [Pseudoxanthomonas broegbernensis]